MSQPLVEVKESEIVQSGIVKGVHPLKAPLWMDGYNVSFRDKSVRKSKGFVAAFTKPETAPVRGLGQLIDAGVQKLYFGTQTKLYRWAGVSVTEIGSGFTGHLNSGAGTLASVWSMESWGSWMLMTNGKDDMQIDKGAGAVALGGTPPDTAEIIVRFNNFIVAFNTDLGGAWSEWCALDDVENWTTLESGNLFIRDLDSPIRCAVKLGDNIALYTDNRMALFSFIGQPFYFGARSAVQGVGAVSKKAVVERSRMNYGLGDKGFWKCDGVGFAYIDDPMVRSWLKKNMNMAQKAKVCARVNEAESTIEWSIPTTTGEPDVIISYSPDAQGNPWSFSNYGRTSLLEQDVFSRPISATATGEVYFDNFGVNADGGALAAMVQSRPFDCGNRNAWKYIDSVRVLLHDLEGTGVRVYIGTQENLDDAILWSTALTPSEAWESLFPAPASGRQLSGRFVYFKIACTEVGDDFALSEFTILGEMDGEDI